MTSSKADSAVKMSISSSLPRAYASRSRSEAIEHGELIDVTELAAEKRFLVPVALTAEVYADVNDLRSHYVLSSDSKESRLDTLLHYARANVVGNELRSGFEFSFYMPVGEATVYNASLRLMPDDNSEQSVITIMKGQEDKSVL